MQGVADGMLLGVAALLAVSGTFHILRLRRFGAMLGSHGLLKYHRAGAALFVGGELAGGLLGIIVATGLMMYSADIGAGRLAAGIFVALPLLAIHVYLQRFTSRSRELDDCGCLPLAISLGARPGDLPQSARAMIHRARLLLILDAVAVMSYSDNAPGSTGPLLSVMAATATLAVSVSYPVAVTQPSKLGGSPDVVRG
jgi:hypothetical protein